MTKKSAPKASKVSKTAKRKPKVKRCQIFGVQPKVSFASPIVRFDVAAAGSGVSINGFFAVTKVAFDPDGPSIPVTHVPAARRAFKTDEYCALWAGIVIAEAP